MNVRSEFKLEVLGTLFPTIMRALASEAEDGEVTGDDLLDFFGLGIAAIIDNDSHLTTPRDLRLAAETAKKRIEGRVKEFRTMQDQAGVSWLALMLDRDAATPS